MKYVRKKRPYTLVDLNSIDSVSLVKLPGIGPWFALRIVEYRDRLGGYCSVGQLAEIDGLQDSLMQWFVVTDTVPIRKVSVNRASLSELRRHPYINFYQARAIVELRRQYGPIKNPDRLSLLDEFTGQDLERLEPYLDFE
jgi:DNA uptake protein ComE-like DNA-binding protein